MRRTRVTVSNQVALCRARVLPRRRYATVIAALLATVATPNAAQAADCTFLPSTGIWHLTDNWNCGLIPMASGSDLARIGVGRRVTIDSDLTAFNLVNDGTIDISNALLVLQGAPGNRISSNQGTINVGTSSTTGTLELPSGYLLQQNESGVVVVHDGSLLRMLGGTIGRIPSNGGALTTLGSGRVLVAAGAAATLNNLTITGHIDATAANALLRVQGNTTLNGLIDIGGGTTLRTSEQWTLDGTGSIVFTDDNAANRMQVVFPGTALPFIVDSGITIHGNTARIEAQDFVNLHAFINNGVISADTGGGTFTVSLNDTLQNNGELSARNGGTLDLTAAGLTTNNGTLGAFDGATLRLRSAVADSVDGHVVAARGSTILVDGGILRTADIALDATSRLRGTTNAANVLEDVTLIGAGAIDLASEPGVLGIRGGLTLDGASVLVGGSSRLRMQGAQTIGGTGTIVLSSNDALRGSLGTFPDPVGNPQRFDVNANLTFTVDVADEGLTLGPDIVLRGAGRIADGSGLINNPFDPRQRGQIFNQGRIAADVAGDTLHIFQPGGVGRRIVNTGSLEARNGGTLLIDNYGVDNAAGEIFIGAGSRLALQGGRPVTGGRITGEAGSTIHNTPLSSLDDVSLLGTIAIASGARLNTTVRTTLDGTLQIGGGARLQTRNAGTSLLGTGSIEFIDGDVSNTIAGSGLLPTEGSFVIASGITVRGVSGRIGGRTQNFGTIDSDGGGTLFIDSGFDLGSPVPFFNAGTLRARSGALAIAPTLTGAGTLQVDATGVMTLANGANTQRVLAMGASGASLDIGTGNLVLDGDYTNLGAGSGNAFDRRAGVAGTGQIRAAGDVAQIITGATVTNGDTTNATLTIGNVRVGTTAVDYRIANVGTTGPTLRGAIQTNVNGANITDARLGGPGVTEGDYVAAGPGADSGPLQVTFTAATAGALTPLVGQVVNLRSNFENIADQKLAIVLADGAAAYHAAVGALQTDPLNFGTVQIGQVVSRDLTVRNVATGPAGFVEDLNVQFGGSSDARVLTSGAFTGIRSGQSSTATNGTMTVSVDTSNAGIITNQFVTLRYLTAGTVNGVSNGLAEAQIGSENYLVSGAIEARVIDRAEPRLNTPVIDFGARRVGDADGSAFVTLTNQSAGAPQAALNASIAGAGLPFSASGSFTGLAPGDTDATSLRVGIASSTAGNFISGSATIQLVSDASNVGNCAPNCTVELTPQVVQLSGRVYATAAATLTGGTTTIDFGTVRRGDTVTIVRALTNTGSGALVDDLIGIATEPTAPFALTAVGLDGGIAAGNAATLTFGVDTSNAGTLSGSASIALASHNDEMADVDLRDLDFQLRATVHNLARPAIDHTSGNGSFSKSSDVLYLWDFGEISELADSVIVAGFAIGNLATGPADNLAGSFRTADSSIYKPTGFTPFTGVAAGGSVAGPSIRFDTALFRPGTYTRSIFFDPRSVFAGLNDLPLAPIELRLTGRIRAEGTTVPAPATAVLILCGLLGSVGLRRVR